MLKKFTAFVLGNPSDDYSRITSSRLANITTPDQLIEAGIIQSVAKSYDDWKIIERNDYGNWPINAIKSTAPYNVENRCNRRLVNSKTGIELLWRKTKDLKDIRGTWQDVITRDMFYILSGSIYIPFDDKAGNHIYTQYEKLGEQLAETKRVAAAAKEKMENDERLWNLAESMLGLKRVNGALVPVTTEPAPHVPIETPSLVEIGLMEQGL